MKQLLIGLLAAACILTGNAQAQRNEAPLQLREGHPTEYTVVRGDTLWGISGRFLDQPWQWPEIWGVNPQIQNPHLIYPGDTVYLTWVDGRPRLGLTPGVRKLSPQIRETALDQAVPAIPLKDIVSFLNDNRVADDDVLSNAPYVVAGDNRRIVSGAGDRVYIRGDLLSDDVQQILYRPSTEYIDPVTGEFLGYELFKVADARITGTENDITTLRLLGTTEEVRAGYRLLPSETTRVQSVFYPKPAPYDTDGLIIDVLQGVGYIGQFDAVVVNLGERDGLESGHVFSIRRKGEVLNDPVTNEVIQLPSERAGIMMIFKVYDKVSYGLVMRATNTISIGDEITRP